MEALLQLLLEQARAVSGLEALAVLLAIAYLLLAIRENAWCWACAGGSTALYVYLFGDVKLYMESLLNLYYFGMAVYGWYSWTHGPLENQRRAIVRWSWRPHALAFVAIAVATATSGFLLSHHTDAALPYVDAFTTWAAVWTTFLVARKVLENWWYWLVIDAISVWLYWERGLLLTALLFVVYLAMIPFGLARWQQRYRHSGALA